jgi:hypothetical protein
MTSFTSGRAWTVLIATLAATGAASGSLAQAADPPKPGTAPPAQISSLDRDRMERQAPLVKAAGIISTAVDAYAASAAHSGFTSIVLADDAVVVRWQGAVPSEVQAAIDRARQDVAVEVRSARHSLAQLTNAAAAAKRALHQSADKAPFTVLIPSDGDGLGVEVEGDVAKARGALRSVGMPVDVRYERNARPAGRYDDTAPFYGGGRILNADNGAGCTAGFAVTNGWTNFLITAGHCGRPGGGWYNGNWNLFIGTANTEHLNYDLLLVPANSSGRIFDGASGNAYSTRWISGFDRVYPNEWMCVSGATTGNVCSIQADTTQVYSYCSNDAYGNWECYGDMFRGWSRSGAVAVQPGDSGGPVYSVSGSNGIAKGIISGQGNGGTKVIFQDFWTANVIWGVRPR